MHNTSYDLAVSYGYKGNPKDWLSINETDIECSLSGDPYIIYKIFNIIHIVFDNNNLYKPFLEDLKNRVHYISKEDNIINIKNKKYLNNIENYCILSLRTVLNDNLNIIINFILSNDIYSKLFIMKDQQEDIRTSLSLIINNDYYLLSLISILKLGKNLISIKI